MSIDPLARPTQQVQDQNIPNGPREPDSDSDIERGPGPLTDPNEPETFPDNPVVTIDDE